MQVEFYLTFIVDSKMKQAEQTGLVVVRWAVKYSLTALVWHHGSGISLVSKDDWADKECINWHLGSRDLAKYHS